jgi:uncharacterized protein YjbI with pentapeptide repeats
VSRRYSPRVLALPLLLLATSLAACAAGSGDAACLRATTKSCAGVDLTGADLTGGEFDGWDFSGANLSGARLEDGSFIGANFDRTRLDNAEASGANFSGASFFASSARRADLSEATLAAADLEGPDLRSADLRDADVSAARLHEVNFTGANLTGGDFRGALFARVFLDGADLSDADLRDTIFVGSRLRGVTITEADFSGALLRGEDDIPAISELPGATICRDRACEASESAPSPTSGAGSAASIAVSGTAFTFAAYNAARFGVSYGESPLEVSRGLALSYLAAFGLYPASADLDILLWEPKPPAAIADGVRDVAALYALANTSISLRRSPLGDAFDGKMRGLILSRDVTLWELTKAAPELRAITARLAVESSDRALRRAASDGFAERSQVYTVSGAWERTPPAYVRALEPHWSELSRFLPGSAACDPPPPVEDPVSAAVEARRIADAATEDQRAAARFWDDERVRTATPPGHWVFIAAEVMQDKINFGHLSVAEAFKTMSEVTIAMADSLSEVWEAKFRYRTARPMTVINRTDPEWGSYLTNPPFPAYPSGHAAVSRAAADVLTATLGSAPFTSDGGTESAGGNRALNISARSFESFDAAAIEAGMSRIWGGIHVMEDFRAAIDLGSCVADLLR